VLQCYFETELASLFIFRYTSLSVNFVHEVRCL